MLLLLQMLFLLFLFPACSLLHGLAAAGVMAEEYCLAAKKGGAK